MAFDSTKQGPHVDPASPNAPKPDRSNWSPRQLKAFSSAAMRAYREGLCGTHGDIRSAVLDDLCSFYHVSPEQCIDRCLNWEKWSVEEWEKRPRTDREGLADFYAKVESWSYDLLWFAYLQAEGHEYPISAVVADSLPKPDRSDPRHLDFGSGIGSTSNMFRRLGYESDLADVSNTLLDFARYRLERRSEKMGYVNLREQKLEPARYDVITAFDTLTHVPKEDFADSVAMLHRSLRPGGVLVANFDTRPASRENAWHLYSDDRLLRFQLQRTGFEPIERLERGFAIYRRVERAGAAYVARGMRDVVLLRSPLRPLVRKLRWFLRDLRSHGSG